MFFFNFPFPLHFLLAAGLHAFFCHRSGGVLLPVACSNNSATLQFALNYGTRCAIGDDGSRSVAIPLSPPPPPHNGKLTFGLTVFVIFRAQDRTTAVCLPHYTRRCLMSLSLTIARSAPHIYMLPSCLACRNVHCLQSYLTPISIPGPMSRDPKVEWGRWGGGDHRDTGLQWSGAVRLLIIRSGSKRRLLDAYSKEEISLKTKKMLKAHNTFQSRSQKNIKKDGTPNLPFFPLYPICPFPVLAFYCR